MQANDQMNVAKALTLDDCVRRAMKGVELPKPCMSADERARFEQQQRDAVVLAKQLYNEGAREAVPNA
jgi:hypothetical protein